MLHIPPMTNVHPAQTKPVSTEPAQHRTKQQPASVLASISWPSLFFFLGIMTYVLKTFKPNQSWQINEANYHLYTFPLTETESISTSLFLNVIFVSAALLIPIEILLVRNACLKQRVITGINLAAHLMEGFFINVIASHSAKTWVSEPRPDFMARCYGDHLATPQFDDKTGNVVCTQEVTHDAFVSLPSGHTSCTTTVGLYLTLLAVYTLYFRKVDLPWRRADGTWVCAWAKNLADFAFVICLLPIAGAFYVALSRVIDHRHSPSDIALGAILGMTVGALYFVRVVTRL
eukprot:m.50185 g.50185  ORF g.50185 m.50185 type:complete len:289 (+) comp11145_c0_seq1:313-1179(+)